MCPRLLLLANSRMLTSVDEIWEGKSFLKEECKRDEITHRGHSCEHTRAQSP